MEDWQKRVIEEKKELDIKIKKLSDFLIKSNNVNHVGLLDLQLSAMNTYSKILGIRILDFVKNVDSEMFDETPNMKGEI